MSEHAVERVPEPEPSAMTPLLSLAVEKGVNVETIERLVALHNQEQDRRAAREFAEAMASFQEECPAIPKTSTAKIVTKAGGQYSYAYAELDEIARTIRPYAHKRGLSHSWDSACDEKTVSATCTVLHINGHSRKATFSAPVDTLASMSGAQKAAAALTFARRQSLIQAYGLTTTDADTDGAEAEPEEPITTPQVELLESLFEQRPEGSLKRALDYLGLKSLVDLPASKFEWLRGDLEKKIREQK